MAHLRIVSLLSLLAMLGAACGDDGGRPARSGSRDATVNDATLRPDAGVDASIPDASGFPDASIPPMDGSIPDVATGDGGFFPDVGAGDGGFLPDIGAGDGSFFPDIGTGEGGLGGCMTDMDCNSGEKCCSVIAISICLAVPTCPL
ncbi:MAG: hypothetical protein AAGF12_15585 [Myxococcota bacterium]